MGGLSIWHWLIVLLVVVLLTHGFGLWGGRGGSGEEATGLVHQDGKIFIPEKGCPRLRVRWGTCSADCSAT